MVSPHHQGKEYKWEQFWKYTCVAAVGKLTFLLLFESQLNKYIYHIAPPSVLCDS